MGFNPSEKELNEIWEAKLESSFFGKIFILPILKRVSQCLAQNEYRGRLLDIGCGSGTITSAFSDYGFEAIGIDFDERRIKKGEEDFPSVDFICHNLNKGLPFPDNSFDVVFSCSVFQYLDHDPIVEECLRVLKEDGSLILVENLKNNPFTRLGRTYLKLTGHKYQSYPWNHFTLHELYQMRTRFQSINLEVFHLISPVILFKLIGRPVPFIMKMDLKLLQFNFVKRFAWLVLFTGKKKSNGRCFGDLQ